MPGWVDINMKIHPEKLKLCLQEKYEAYALSVGERLREAAIVVFEQGQRNDNEWRKSNRTPPKYISSFRVSYHRATLTTRVENTDPGWATVEFGFHPRDGVTFVEAIKPLRRGLLRIAKGV